jgi:hypothetical protein
MSSMAHGFLGGFNAAENAFQRRDNNAMRERQFQSQQQQVGLNNAYRQEQLALQKSADGRSAEESKLRVKGLGLTNTLNQLQLDNFNADHELEVQTKEGINNARNAQTKANEQQVKDSIFKQGLQRLQTYQVTGDWAGFVTDPAFKNTDIELIQNGFGADTAIALNQAFQSGDRKSVVSNFNTLYKPKLNRNVGNMTGRDGGVIKDIEAIDYEEVTDAQGNSSIKIPVRVTTDKGQYTSYISEMRGINPDDPDKVFSPDELIGKVGAMGNLATILRSSGVYDQMGKGVGRYMTTTIPTTNGSEATARQKEWDTIRQVFGEEGLKKFIYESREMSPSQARLKAYQTAYDTLHKQNSNPMLYASERLTPEQIQEQAEIIANQAYEFSQRTNTAAPTGQVQQQPQTNPTGKSDPLGLRNGNEKLLKQAGDAIKAGRDPDAVRGRLLELGVPENQVNQWVKNGY